MKPQEQPTLLVPFLVVGRKPLGRIQSPKKSQIIARRGGQTPDGGYRTDFLLKKPLDAA